MIKHFHATDIRTYLECPRKFYYDKVERLTSNRPTPDYFEFGTIGHEMLAAYYRGEDYELDATLNDEQKNLINALISGYKKQYPLEQELNQFQIAAVESPLIVNHCGIELQFTMDLLTLWNRSTYKIIDHKFYSRLPDEELLDFDFQASFYIWAAKKCGLNVKEYVLNVIRKTPDKAPNILKDGSISKAQTTLDATSYDIYLAMIEGLNLNPKDYANELDFLQRRGSNVYRRYVARRSDKFIENFEADLTQLLNTIRNENNRFIPAPNLNCPRCQFKFLCKVQSNGGDYDFVKRIEYKVKDDNER